MDTSTDLVLTQTIEVPCEGSTQKINHSLSQASCHGSEPGQLWVWGVYSRAEPAGFQAAAHHSIGPRVFCFVLRSNLENESFSILNILLLLRVRVIMGLCLIFGAEPAQLQDAAHHPDGSIWKLHAPCLPMQTAV